MIKKQNGITLIALVITIIVLLILAGVTIAMLSGENGILTRATTTKEANAEATAREEVNLAYMAVRTEIAAQKVKDGNYNPAAHQGDLYTAAIAGTLTENATNGWVITGNTNATGENIPSASSGNTAITLVYHNPSLSNKDTVAGTEHTLTYTITLKNSLKTTGALSSDALLTGPTEGYKQITE